MEDKISRCTKLSRSVGNHRDLVESLSGVAQALPENQSHFRRELLSSYPSLAVMEILAYV